MTKITPDSPEDKPKGVGKSEPSPAKPTQKGDDFNKALDKMRRETGQERPKSRDEVKSELKRRVASSQPQDRGPAAPPPPKPQPKVPNSRQPPPPSDQPSAGEKEPPVKDPIKPKEKDKQKSKEAAPKQPQAQQPAVPTQPQVGGHAAAGAEQPAGAGGGSPVDKIIAVFQNNPVYGSRVAQVQVSSMGAESKVAVTLQNGIAVEVTLQPGGKDINLVIRGISAQAQAALDNPANQASLQAKLTAQGFTIHQIQTFRGEQPATTTPTWEREGGGQQGGGQQEKKDEGPKEEE